MLSRMTKKSRVGGKVKGAKAPKAKKQGKGAKKFDFEIAKKVSFNDDVEISAYVEESSVTTDDESYSEDYNYDESSDEEIETPQASRSGYMRNEEEGSENEEEETDEDEEEDTDEEEEGIVEMEEDEMSLEESVSSIEEVLSSDYEEETVTSDPESAAEKKEEPPAEQEDANGAEEAAMFAYKYRNDSGRFRPDDYLGGSMPALLQKAPKKVKLRKSWLPTKEDDEANEAEEVGETDGAIIEVTPKGPNGGIDPVKEKFNISYQSFFSPEVGGVTKSKVAKKKCFKSTKKGTEPQEIPEDEPVELQNVDVVETSEKPKEKESTPTNKTAKKVKASYTQSKKQPKRKAKEAKGKRKAPAATENLAENMSPKRKMVPVSTISVERSSLEIEDAEERLKREREMQELRAKAAELRKKLHKIEIEKSSELADLAEKTTHQMREYRAKARDVKRKKKAKMEKQTLKENTMKSQDLVEYLKNSNKKLREEGIQMARAIRELKEHNESIQEETSFRLDYLRECNAHHEKEIAISTSIQKQLKIDLPNYEVLVKELSESVEARDRNGQVENRVKTLFCENLNKMVEMVEESCSNSDLIYTIVDIVNENEDDVKQQALNRRQFSSNTGSSNSSGKREPPRSSSKVRTSFRSNNYSDVTVEPKREPKRVSNSGLVKRKPSFGSLGGKELSFSDEETAATSLWDDSSCDVSLENY